MGSQYNPAFQNQPEDSSLSQVPTGTLIGQPEKYLLLERTLIPNKESYSLNESIRVYVLIKSIRFSDPNSTLDDVRINEIVDNGFALKENSTKCCVISDIESLVNYQNNISKKIPYEEHLRCYPISWGNGIGAVKFGNNFSLGGNDRLVYWYNIIPLEYGILNLKTIIGSKKYSNIDYPFLIKIKKAEPIFDVSLMTMKTRVFQYEPLRIVYNINYLGDLDTYKNASIVIDNPSEYGYFKDDNKSETFKGASIKKYETFSIWKTIEFPYTGEYYPPGITIEGVYYAFDRPLITVDNPISRNESNFLSIVALFTIISSLVGVYLIGYRKYKISYIIEAIKSSFINIIDYVPQIIRIVIVLILFIFSLIYLTNSEYIRYSTFILTNIVYIFILMLGLLIFAYDFKYKNIFPYWVLFWLIIILLLIWISIIGVGWMPMSLQTFKIPF
jgi:hypothetical protein